jgi:hypothetical protein
MWHSFVLCKRGLKSDFHTGIKVTLCLLIIFVGIGGKHNFICNCCLVFLTHLMLSYDYHFLTFITFLCGLFLNGGWIFHCVCVCARACE